MDQCPGQQDAVDLHVDEQDVDSPPCGKELSRWVAQLESEMKGKSQTISEQRSTVDELADTVAKTERCAQRHQSKSKDQMRQYKEEWERLCARVAALEAELVSCGRPPLKQILVLPSTSGYQLWQVQKDLGGNCGHSKTKNGKGGKWSRHEYNEEKENKTPESSGKWADHP